MLVDGPLGVPDGGASRGKPSWRIVFASGGAAREKQGETTTWAGRKKEKQRRRQGGVGRRVDVSTRVATTRGSTGSVYALLAGGKVKTRTAFRRPLWWRSNSAGGHVSGVHSRRSGASTRCIGVSFSSHSHSSGSMSVARSALLPHVSARRRRKSSTVSFTANCAVPRFHCGCGASAFVRQRNASTTAMI